MRSQRLLFSLAGLLLGVLASPLHAQRETLPPQDQEIVKQKWPDAKRSISGLRYVVEKEGTGDPANPGDQVSVLYTGMLLDGTVFNEAKDPNNPFTFRVGRGLVIEGWDQALRLMREGSKMTLIVPYELGYGTRGNPPHVPRAATLVFEIELLKIERGPNPQPVLEPPAKKKKK
jgi:FKBP-type peptidyl-prolyl cis-trans isomerase